MSKLMHCEKRFFELVVASINLFILPIFDRHLEKPDGLSFSKKLDRFLPCKAMAV